MSAPSADPLAAASRARWSYLVRTLRAPDGRRVVVLGEIHLKLARADAIGRQLVDAFPLRGVEGFPARRVFLGRALALLVIAPRIVLRIASLGLVKDSTIAHAKICPTGTTARLEDDAPIPIGLHVGSATATIFFASAFSLPLLAHVPQIEAVIALRTTLAVLVALLEIVILVLGPLAWVLRDRAGSWLLCPPITIVTARDRIMATGAVAMLARQQEGDALLIMGRAHVRGVVRILVEEHGFHKSE
jgi:hypothetical protein